MRTHGVVDLFPVSQFAIEFSHLPGARWRARTTTQAAQIYRPVTSGPTKHQIRPRMLPWLSPRANHSHKFFPLDSCSNFVHAGFTSHPAPQPVSAKLMYACPLCSGTADFLTSLFSTET